MNVAARPERLNVISLCSGGGGLDLGLGLALPSARTICFLEREAFAVAHLVAAMQDGWLDEAPVWSDARTFDGRRWRGVVDCVIGGIPCQPHSLAGRKRGSHDERDLWSDARRIIVQSRPSLVVIENVRGMLSAGADEIAGAERVWRDLRKLGFAVECGLFSAAEVGAPHERARLFVVGVADTNGGGRWPQDDAGQPPNGIDWSGRGLVDATIQRRGEGWASSETWSARSAADTDGALVHAERSERRQEAVRGRNGDRQEGGRDEATSWAGKPDTAMADAAVQGGWGLPVRPGRQDETDANVDWPSEPMADADLAVLRREPSAGELALLQQDDGHGSLHQREHLADRDSDEPPAFGRNTGEVSGGQETESWPEHGPAVSGGGSLFPPGPGDRDAWAAIIASRPDLAPAIESPLRGVADELAATRIDWLRLLGNGVVPLAAGYAIRTLLARLAARGSAEAARLVRGMT